MHCFDNEMIGIIVAVIVLVILLAVLLIYRHCSHNKVIGGTIIDLPGYLYTMDRIRTIIYIPKPRSNISEDNITKWNDVMNSIRNFAVIYHNACNKLKCKHTLDVGSFKTYIYGNKELSKTNNLFIFIHGGDDTGLYHPPLISDKYDNFLLKHIDEFVSNRYDDACNSLFREFTDINSKYNNPYTQLPDKAKEIYYRFKLVDKNNKNTATLLKEYGNMSPYDYTDVTNGMYSLYYKLVDNGIDVAVLHYDDNDECATEQLSKQLRLINSFGYSNITLCGHSYGGYLTSLLLANTPELLKECNNVILSAPLVTEGYVSTSAITIPKPFHSKDPSRYVPGKINSNTYNLINELCKRLEKIRVDSPLTYHYRDRLIDNSPIRTYFDNFDLHLVDRSELNEFEIDSFNDISNYYVYLYPFSDHAFIPIDKIQSVPNRVNEYKGNLFIACAADDSNTMYNIEFKNLYDNINRMRNGNVTTITIQKGNHGYIRNNEADDMFIDIVNGKKLVSNSRIAINNPKFDIDSSVNGYNNSLIKIYLNRLIVVRTDAH